MFLLCGIAAACGERCCAVWISGKELVIDADGNVLYECETLLRAHGAFICRADGGDRLYIDPDTCEELPDAPEEARGAAKHAVRRAGYDPVMVVPLSDNVWIALANDGKGNDALLAVEGGSARELCGLGSVLKYSFFSSVLPHVKVFVAHSTIAALKVYAVTKDKCAELDASKGGADVVGALMTLDVAASLLPAYGEPGSDASLLFPGFYAGASVGRAFASSIVI
jgi:hypothetical protein